jgi:O-antigen ligase
VELLFLLGIPALLAWWVVYCRLFGVAGCLVATLLAGTVLGQPFFQISVVTFDRLILGASIALFVGYQLRGWNQPRAWSPADLLFAFFLFALILTTVLHPSSGDRVGPFSKLIFFFLLPAVMYMIGGHVTLTPKQLRLIYAAFAVLGIYLALTAVAEKLDLKWAVFPKYIADPKFVEFLGRGRGPLLNPAANGILLTLAVCCGIMPLLWYRGITQLSVLATVPIYLVGLACTLTRSVWMGSAVALVGITVALLPTRWRLAMAMAVLGCGSLSMLVDVKSLLTFKRDRNVTVEQMSESANLRPILAMVAWKMFQDRPLLGCGTGQYLAHAKNYLFDRSTKLPLEKVRPYVQHNMFLAMLVENGLIALIPFCCLLVCWSHWSWQLWKSSHLALEYRQLGLVSLGLLSAYIVNGMFHDVLIFPMINMYMFFIAGSVRNCAVHFKSPCHKPIQTTAVCLPPVLSYPAAQAV